MPTRAEAHTAKDIFRAAVKNFPGGGIASIGTEGTEPNCSLKVRPFRKLTEQELSALPNTISLPSGTVVPVIYGLATGGAVAASGPTPN